MACLPSCKWRRSTLAAVFVAVLAIVALGRPGFAGAVTLPAGFQADTLDIPRHSASEPNGLEAPVSIAFAPGGRMFVNEKAGQIVTFDSNADTTPTLTADISADVQNVSDRGLIGLAVDPAYPAKPFIYVSYSYSTGGGGDGCVPLQANNYTDCPGAGRVVRIRVNPATGVASNGSSEQPVNPPQTILASNWCMQFTSHAMDDLGFAPDGMLLASAGDGADFETADYGEYGNPCGDPPNEGGSFRSQDAYTTGDPLGYNGSVISIDPHPEDSPGPHTPTMLAYGLRNPFRFEVRPGTNQLWIGDVGNSIYEEIDRSQTALGGSQPGPLNFGWPCYEGTIKHPPFNALAGTGQVPICDSLYSNNTTTGPWYEYHHASHVATGEACPPQNNSSITGLAFYQPSLATQGDPFPTAYDGALFFADYARRCMWTIDPSTSQGANPVEFASSSNSETFTPVDIVQGPDGLYIPNIQDNSITRIRYFASNVPPVASLTADHTYGGTPLTVHFDASGSSDPEGGDLHYAWDTNGDGQFTDGTDSPTLTKTYSAGDMSNHVVSVKVTDGGGLSDIAHLTVYPGDLGPPVPVIDSPSADLQYTVGDTISYSGRATDPDAGQPVQLDWTIQVRHCPSECHTHPLTTVTNSSGGTQVAPPHEDPSHLQFILTATDARGLSASTTRDVYPRRVALNLYSAPAGVPLTFQAQSADAPWSTTMPAGNQATVVAPETVTIGGISYRFTGWSDGGARGHNVSPRTDTTLTASYAPVLGTVLLRSKPRGIPLRVGSERKAAPFSNRLPLGSAAPLAAPRRVRHRGRIWVFSRWSNDALRSQSIAIGDTQTYTAIYRLKPR